jgi:hypothetical protein
VAGRDRSTRAAPGRIEAAVDFGTAHLVPDNERPGGWTLLVDGAAQSYVDLTDPTYLRFEYVRRLASVIDAVAPAGVPLRVLHLGGGGLTLARYIAATRPGSRQRVIERDEALVTLVRQNLPLPRRVDVRVRTEDARAAVEAYRDARFDLVIGDVYRDARMPRAMASTEFAAHVARVVRPDGLYAVNVADVPPLDFTRAHAATLSAAFAEVVAIADPLLLRGRRMGNVVLVAAALPGGVPAAALADAARRDELPGHLLRGTALTRFMAGALPMTDATASDSPLPPRLPRPPRPRQAGR